MTSESVLYYKLKWWTDSAAWTQAGWRVSYSHVRCPRTPQFTLMFVTCSSLCSCYTRLRSEGEKKKIRKTVKLHLMWLSEKVWTCLKGVRKTENMKQNNIVWLSRPDLQEVRFNLRLIYQTCQVAGGNIKKTYNKTEINRSPGGTNQLLMNWLLK